MASSMLMLAQTGSLTRGLAIALSGLTIVFTALILISIFIASLPRILDLVSRVWPESDNLHQESSDAENSLPDDAVLAAIGFVLHTEVQRQILASSNETPQGQSKS